MTQSEESITLMTFYRLPHYSSRSFAGVLDDVLLYPVCTLQECNKKNRSESVPDGHKSDGIQVFQNFSKNTLENFHIRIRYALVETSVQGDGFFAADFFHFFCPVGEEEAVFPCIFFYPLFAYEAFLIMIRTMTVIVGLVRWRWSSSTFWVTTFLCVDR